MSWALVQSAAIYASADGSSTITNSTVPLGTGAQNGNLLVALFTWHTDASILSVTDNGTGATNTWYYTTPNSFAPTLNATANQKLALAWCVNACTSGTLTYVTCTITSVEMYRVVILEEWSGNAASPLDGTPVAAAGSHTGGTDNIASGYTTPTVSGDLIIGVEFGMSTTLTAGTGFSNLVQDDAVVGAAMESRVESGTAQNQALFSDSGAEQHVCGVIAFKAFGNGGAAGLMWL